MPVRRRPARKRASRRLSGKKREAEPGGQPIYGCHPQFGVAAQFGYENGDLRPFGQRGRAQGFRDRRLYRFGARGRLRRAGRSEEHTSELQSLMRIPYAVFCLKKKNSTKTK